jgi:hypothetical protein
MTEQDQIKALAELDGWDETKYSWVHPSGSHYSKTANNGRVIPDLDILPRYNTSYDAIIPLIQKQSELTKVNTWDWLRYRLTKHVCPFDYTPAQLCEALLRATGKWKE